jgi:RecA/RadA recombinase
MALDPSQLAEKLKKVYKTKKRDAEDIGTGMDIKPPTFYVGAPKPMRQLLDGRNYPGRRIVQISGKPNSGKTTLGMLAMVEAQKGYYNKDGTFVEEPINVILIDTEGKFSEARFRGMGGDPAKLFRIGATTLEDVFFGINETLNVIYSEDEDAKVLIVLDSLGGTPSATEAEADADESIQLATAAKVIKRNLRVFVPKWLSRKDIAMIVINTNYANIGSVGRSNSGGDGAEFASAFIVQLSRVSNLTYDEGDSKVQEGIITQASVTKNHLQTKATALKQIQYEVYAYEVKAIDKFKLKNKAEFVNDTGRILVTKAKKKDNQITFLTTFDDKSDPQHNKSQTTTYEQLMEILEKGEFDQLTGDSSSEEAEV